MLGKALGCVSGWPGRVATSSTTLASPGLAAFVRFGRQRCAVCDPSACVRACVRACVCVCVEGGSLGGATPGKRRFRHYRERPVCHGGMVSIITLLPQPAPGEPSWSGRRVASGEGERETQTVAEKQESVWKQPQSSRQLHRCSSAAPVCHAS